MLFERERKERERGEREERPGSDFLSPLSVS